MAPPAILATNLTKRFGSRIVVDAVSFHVAQGEIFGFLGPNGAGKSTVVAMLTTLQTPSSGSAQIGGFDVRTEAAVVRRVAGVALQDVGLDPLMTAPELLILQARLYGIPFRQARARADELLALVALDQPATRRQQVGTYSGGMRRRLDLALALVHRPAVLFLDEPTTGLDPASRQAIWAEVRRLNAQQGVTVFLTTQYLEEADALAGRVAIINGGKIAVTDTPAALKARLGTESVTLTFSDPATAQAGHTLLQGRSVAPAQLDGAMLRLYLPQAASAVPAIVGELQAAGHTLSALTLREPTLDDVFLEVTGQRLAVDAPTAAVVG
jgi:ABC-2 type transport system ATP-binding protein